MPRTELDLRLIVITDAALAGPRPVGAVVREALAAGAPAIQLRDKDATARQLYNQAVELRRLTREFDALLFVNDRFDVAVAAEADGVHLGPDDLPLAAVRRAAPRPFLVGASTDDPAQARMLAAAGADYIGCGAVFGTSSKDVGEERIGPAGLRAVVSAIDIPVVGIGGVDVTNVAEIAGAGAVGAAVIRAVMTATNVTQAVTALLAPFAP